MAFDPAAYLKSVGVEPDVKNDASNESAVVASGFDPAAYLRSVDSQQASSAFDPAAYLRSVSEPTEAVAPATQPAQIVPATQPFQISPETGFSSFIPAVKRGTLGLVSLGGDVLPAMAGRVGEKLGIQGAKEYADRQMAEAAQSQKEIEQNYPSAVPSYTNIKGAGDLLTYIVEAVGESIPSLLPSIFTGGAAGFIGRGATIAAKQAAEKAVIAAAAEGVTGAELQSLAMKAGVDAARKTALKYEAAGALAGSAVQNIPDVYQSIAQSTGKEALGATLVAGGFNTVLDAITPLNLMRIARKRGFTPDELIGGWVKRLGKGFAEGLITEGGTEAVQEMSTAAAEKFVDQNKNFFTRDNFVRFLDSGLKGGLGGGAITGATNVAFNRATPSISPLDELVKGEQKLANEEEQRARFDELNAITKGTENQIITDETGKQVKVPGQLSRIFTPEERADYRALKEKFAPTIAAPAIETVVPFSASQDTAAMLGETEGKPLVKAPEEMPPMPMVIPSLQTIEAPVADLKISKDVPQFKYGADASTGVVEPLGGKFERTGVAPIQLWERNNGDLEVISGRHRLDLAKRSGEATIPAQVHKESEGFDVTQAASLDALLNIREGQGKVKDYVTYFQRPGYTREEAQSSGVLARSTGQRAYSIATNGSSDLIAAHRADVLTDEAATRIANSAPKEDSVQALGMKLIQEGKSINNAVNMMQAVKAISGGRGEATTDMFGFDDSAMREAEEMAKIASKKQADISQDLSAVTGASKRPEVAKKYGVDVRDPASLQAKIDELRQQKMAWENWSSNPALVTQIQNQIRGIESEIEVAPEIDTSTPSMFESRGTLEQEVSADSVLQRHKSKFKGASIAYRNGDITLIKTMNPRTGGVIYTPAKGASYPTFLYDITSDEGRKQLTALGLTVPEKRELVFALQNLEAAEQAKHEKTPYLKIKPGINASDAIPKNMLGVIKGWNKLLNLKGNIYITTVEDAVANKDKYTGPHRTIGNLGIRGGTGVTTKLKDGTSVIVFEKSSSLTKMLEIVAHEMGHIHEKEVFNNAPPETQAAIKKAYDDWRSGITPKTPATELVNKLRAKTTAQTTIMPAGVLVEKVKDVDYWTGFNEWYADQVARWSVSSEKPITVVDKFFAKLATALRRFYNTVKGQNYLPNETFKQYLDTVASKAQMDSLIEEKAPKGQMALFMRGEVEAEGLKGIENLSRVRRNYRNQIVSPTDVFSIPDDSKMERFIYKIQDKYIDTKRVIQAIIAQGKEITDKWNAYLKEELYHGRTAKRTKDFLNNELLPVVRSMLKQGISIVEFDTYLQARHAEERNKQIAKINPEFIEEEASDGTIIRTPNPNAMPDGGSGMFTKDAQDYLDKLPLEKAKALEELAKKIDAIVKGTQQVLIDAGLESQSTIDVWNKTYEKYVPLMRKDLDFAQDYTGLGQGFQTRGGASKRAFGSFKEVADIFANIANQRERAIVRAEKARVGTALYGLAIMNPNPNFWLPVNPDAIKNEKALLAELRGLGISEADAANIIQEPQTAVLDPDTGTVTYKVNPILRNSPNVFAIRINGQERFIFFNASDPRAMRMVQAIKNLDAEEMGWALGNAAKVTRWIASVNTQYNPVFGAYNFIRDTLGAQFNLSTTAIAGKQAQVTAGVFPALYGIYSDLRAARAGKGVAKGEWAKLWEEYQKEGGATGYRDQFSKNRSDQNVIEKEMRNLKKGNVKKGVAAVFNWLSDYNDAMENAVRLSAYKVAIDQGISKEQAASIAKNLTVNFNRKGERAQQMGALYAFYNASVQGTTRLAETLRGPAGKKIVAGGLLLGSVQALALAMMGFKDDEPPEFIKARNLVIPFPDGNYIAIPMPLGLHIIPNIGRITTEMVMNGGKNAGKKTLNLTGVLMDAFNPIGNAGLSMQSLSPTMLDPIAAIIENKDTFGRPIAREDRATNPTPGYTRARETASYLGKELSYFLNLASGGTKYQKGLISPTPDQIDFLVGQATGGVGREISKVEQTVTATVTGEDLPTYKVPLVGKFYGDVQSQAAQANRFYDNVTRMANYENEIKGRRKDGVATADFFRDHPEAKLWQQANRLENQISTINKEKKNLLEKNAPAARIKQLDERKTRIITQFNNQVESLEK